MKLAELKEKIKTQSDIIQKLIEHKNSKKHELDKYETVLRFVKGFIKDLEKLES